MHFKGQLLLPGESGPGLSVNLDVAEHHLAVESSEGGLGAWPLEVVSARRLQGDTFAMTVAGEDLHFVADDTISFAYSGLPALTRGTSVRSRNPLRSVLTKLWKEDTVPSTAPLRDASPPTTESDPPEAQPSRDEESREPDRPASPGASAEVEVPELYRQDERDAIDIDLFEDNGCPALRTDGQACLSPILTSRGYCYAHDPARRAKDGYRSAQEAREKLKRQSTAKLNSIYKRLDKAMRQVERGELDPEMATAMAQLARTMCAILDLDDSPEGVGGSQA